MVKWLENLFYPTIFFIAFVDFFFGAFVSEPFRTVGMICHPRRRFPLSEGASEGGTV